MCIIYLYIYIYIYIYNCETNLKEILRNFEKESFRGFLSHSIRNWRDIGKKFLFLLKKWYHFSTSETKINKSLELISPLEQPVFTPSFVMLLWFKNELPALVSIAISFKFISKTVFRVIAGTKTTKMEGTVKNIF